MLSAYNAESILAIPRGLETSGLQFRKLSLYPLSYGIIFQFSVQYIVAQLPLPVNTIETIFFKIYPFKSISNASFNCDKRESTHVSCRFYYSKTFVQGLQAWYDYSNQ